MPRPKENKLVSVENVTKEFRYNGNQISVIRDVSLDIRKGQLYLLLGPSGSGKTTLLTIMAGLLPPSKGRVSLFGKEIINYSAKELQQIRASKIGFVFQTFNLIDSLSSIDNIALSGQFAGKSKSVSKKAATKQMEEIAILHLADKYPPQLSQGEKQRVAVARALINWPELILADEPTASLESSQGLDIIRLLHDYSKRQNKAVVVVSHDQRICRYAGKILYVQDGRINSTELKNCDNIGKLRKQKVQ